MSFTLIVDHIVHLHTCLFKKKQFNFSQLLNFWRGNILPLIMNDQYNVDVCEDFGNNTNLMNCCMFLLPIPDDPLAKLAHYILDRTQQHNTPNIYGQTALFILIAREFPIDYIAEFIKKGLDVNSRCLRGIGGGSVRISLLSHCVNMKNYEALSLLLTHNADPNLQAKKEAFFSSNDHNNEALLTPFQLAVATQEQQAINYFKQHATSLNTDMNVQETTSRGNISHSRLEKNWNRFTDNI